MNLQKITDFFPWAESSSATLSNQFTLCLDRCSTSGEFVFLYLLLKFIKEGRQVVLVSCNHTPSHYISILRKNNVDAVKLQQSGRLEILCVSEELPALNWEQLIQLQDTLLSQSRSTGEDSPVMLVDDLDMLELLAPSARAARMFMSRCISALQSRTDQQSGLHALVAFGRHPLESVAQLSSLGAQNATGTELSAAGAGAAGTGGQGSAAWLSARAPVSQEDQEPALCEYLRYRADVTITASALATGYSSAVHGVVTVALKNSAPKRQVLQYKALDSGVLCNIVGHTTF